jgi:hypothetical protein
MKATTIRVKAEETLFTTRMCEATHTASTCITLKILSLDILITLLTSMSSFKGHLQSWALDKD